MDPDATWTMRVEAAVVVADVDAAVAGDAATLLLAVVARAPAAEESASSNVNLEIQERKCYIHFFVELIIHVKFYGH